MNVYEAKAQLSALLRRVEAGEEFVLARAGTPVARLVPYSSVAAPRKPGAWRGRVVIAEDFDELPSELVAAFDSGGTSTETTETTEQDAPSR